MTADGFDYSHHYGLWHDGSQAHRAEMVGWLAPRLANMLPDWHGRSVLDVGCAEGFALDAAFQLGAAKAKGIDVNEQLAARAKAHGHDVEVVVDTPGHLLSMVTGSFDVVLLLDVLEHIPEVDRPRLLTGIRNVLAPWGQLLITTPNAASICASYWRHFDPTHVTSFTPSSLTSVLRGCGFGDPVLQPTGLARRPPIRLWRREAREEARRWLVRAAWRQTLIAELGPTARDLPLDLDIIAVVPRD